MIDLSRLARWAVRSHEQAVANAREAAVESSRRRVERAEVDAFLARAAVTHAARAGHGSGPGSGHEREATRQAQ